MPKAQLFANRHGDSSTSMLQNMTYLLERLDKDGLVNARNTWENESPFRDRN